jgi:hypothetical protein
VSQASGVRPALRTSFDMLTAAGAANASESVEGTNTQCSVLLQRELLHVVASGDTTTLQQLPLIRCCCNCVFVPSGSLGLVAAGASMCTMQPSTASCHLVVLHPQLTAPKPTPHACHSTSLK